MPESSTPQDVIPRNAENSAQASLAANDAVSPIIGTEQDRVLAAVDTNTQLLQQIQAQLSGLCEGLVSDRQQAPTHLAADSSEADSLRARIKELDSQVSELSQQNSDLAAKLATSSIRKAVATDDVVNETLSWAERKSLILQQMEEDSFDAPSFVDSLQEGVVVGPNDDENPVSYVQRLNDELARREAKVGELQHLLEQQSETRQTGVSIGASALAAMIDSDELVREERARLQQLQVEWEDKFRQGEIEASLERAKLSRERRELAAKQTQLDAELERVRRKVLQDSEKDAPRKWLSQLGLASS